MFFRRSVCFRMVLAYLAAFSMSAWAQQNVKSSGGTDPAGIAERDQINILSCPTCQADQNQLRRLGEDAPISALSAPGSDEVGVNVFNGKPSVMQPIGMVGKSVNIPWGISMAYVGTLPGSNQSVPSESRCGLVGCGWNAEMPGIVLNHKGTVSASDDVYFANLGVLGGGQIMPGGFAGRDPNGKYIQIWTVVGSPQVTVRSFHDLPGKPVQWFEAEGPGGVGMVFGKNRAWTIAQVGASYSLPVRGPRQNNAPSSDFSWPSLRWRWELEEMTNKEAVSLGGQIVVRIRNLPENYQTASRSVQFTAPSSQEILGVPILPSVSYTRSATWTASYTPRFVEVVRKQGSLEFVLEVLELKYTPKSASELQIPIDNELLDKFLSTQPVYDNMTLVGWEHSGIGGSSRGTIAYLPGEMIDPILAGRSYPSKITRESGSPQVGSISNSVDLVYEKFVNNSQKSQVVLKESKDEAQKIRYDYVIASLQPTANIQNSGSVMTNLVAPGQTRYRSTGGVNPYANALDESRCEGGLCFAVLKLPEKNLNVQIYRDQGVKPNASGVGSPIWQFPCSNGAISCVVNEQDLEIITGSGWWAIVSPTSKNPYLEVWQLRSGVPVNVTQEVVSAFGNLGIALPIDGTKTPKDLGFEFVVFPSNDGFLIDIKTRFPVTQRFPQGSNVNYPVYISEYGGLSFYASSHSLQEFTITGGGVFSKSFPLSPPEHDATKTLILDDIRDLGSQYIVTWCDWALDRHAFNDGTVERTATRHECDAGDGAIIHYLITSSGEIISMTAALGNLVAEKRYSVVSKSGSQWKILKDQSGGFARGELVSAMPKYIVISNTPSGSGVSGFSTASCAPLGSAPRSMDQRYDVFWLGNPEPSWAANIASVGTDVQWSENDLGNGSCSYDYVVTGGDGHADDFNTRQARKQEFQGPLGIVPGDEFFVYRYAWGPGMGRPLSNSQLYHGAGVFKFIKGVYSVSGEADPNIFNIFEPTYLANTLRSDVGYSPPYQIIPLGSGYLLSHSHVDDYGAPDWDNILERRYSPDKLRYQALYIESMLDANGNLDGNKYLKFKNIEASWNYLSYGYGSLSAVPGGLIGVKHDQKPRAGYYSPYEINGFNPFSEYSDPVPAEYPEPTLEYYKYSEDPYSPFAIKDGTPDKINVPQHLVARAVQGSTKTKATTSSSGLFFTQRRLLESSANGTVPVQFFSFLIGKSDESDLPYQCPVVSQVTYSRSAMPDLAYKVGYLKTDGSSSLSFNALTKSLQSERTVVSTSLGSGKSISEHVFVTLKPGENPEPSQSFLIGSEVRSSKSLPNGEGSFVATWIAPKFLPSTYSANFTKEPLWALRVDSIRQGVCASSSNCRIHTLKAFKYDMASGMPAISVDSVSGGTRVIQQTVFDALGRISSKWSWQAASNLSGFNWVDGPILDPSALSDRIPNLTKTAQSEFTYCDASLDAQIAKNKWVSCVEKAWDSYNTLTDAQITGGTTPSFSSDMRTQRITTRTSEGGVAVEQLSPRVAPGVALPTLSPANADYQSVVRGFPIPHNVMTIAAPLSDVAVLVAEEGQIPGVTLESTGWESGGGTYSSEASHTGTRSVKVVDTYGPTRNIFPTSLDGRRVGFEVTAWILGTSATVPMLIAELREKGATAGTLGNTIKTYSGAPTGSYTQGKWQLWRLHVPYSQLVADGFFSVPGRAFRIWAGTGGPSNTPTKVVYVDDMVARPDDAPYNVSVIDPVAGWTVASYTESQVPVHYDRDSRGVVIAERDEFGRSFGQSASQRFSEGAITTGTGAAPSATKDYVPSEPSSGLWNLGVAFHSGSASTAKFLPEVDGGSWLGQSLAMATWYPGQFRSGPRQGVARVYAVGTAYMVDVYQDDGGSRNRWSMERWSSGAMTSAAVATTLVRQGDFSGDGLTDLLFLQPTATGYDLSLLRSTGNSFTGPYDWGTIVVDAGAKVLSGDFDGDKAWDLAVVWPDANLQATIKVAKSTGIGFGTPTIWGSSQGGYWNEQQWLAADFTGDGRWDIAKVFTDKYSNPAPTATGCAGGECLARADIHVANAAGTGFTWGVKRLIDGEGWFWDSQEWGAADMNGDGKADLVNVFSESGQFNIDVHVITGGGTAASTSSYTRWLNSPRTFQSRQWALGAFNTDAGADLLLGVAK